MFIFKKRLKIEKNNAAKRMGSSLQEMKKKAAPLSDGKRWGGTGQLTENMINNMQKYYYTAIKNNLGNVEATRQMYGLHSITAPQLMLNPITTIAQVGVGT